MTSISKANHPENIVSNAVKSMSSSGTLGMNKIIAELKERNIDIIALTAGEPKGAIPESARHGAINAIEQGHNGYTSSNGIVSLRSIIADKNNKDLAQEVFGGISPDIANILAQYAVLAKSYFSNVYTAKDVIVTNGCKQALFNLFMATINPGDEVLIIKPYWQSYVEMIKLFGGKPVFIHTDDNFAFDMQDIYDATTKQTKFILINSPNNPTGAVYKPEIMLEICRHAYKNSIHIVSDEIYRGLSYDEHAFSMSSVAYLAAIQHMSANDQGLLHDRPTAVNDISEQVKSYLSQIFIIDGLSKRCCMPGWRLGWIVSTNEAVIDAIYKIQSQSTSNVCNIAQYAALAAIRDEVNGAASHNQYSKEMLQHYKHKRDLIVKLLNPLLELDLYYIVPQGAFYIFLDVSKFNQCTGKTTPQLVEDLLYEHHIAVIDGGIFGASEHVRISFTEDDSKITAGCNKLLQYFSSHMNKTISHNPQDNKT